MLVSLLLLIILYALFMVILNKNWKFDLPGKYTFIFTFIFLIYALLTTIINVNIVKFLELFSVLLPVSLFILIKAKDEEINIIKWIVIFSCLIQAVVLIIDRSHVIHWILNYLLVGSLLPVAIIYCFGSVWTTERLTAKLFYFSTFCVMFLGLMRVQGRYSAMAAVVGIIIVFILNFRAILRSTFGKILLLALFTQLPNVWTLIKTAHAYKRFLEFNILEFDRIEIFHGYLLIVKNNWISGFGAGGTPELAFHFYPHNYILEFFTEFGVIGLGFAILITFAAAINLALTYRLNNSNDRFVAILLVYYVFFFLKSATIYDAYVLFICFGLALSRSRESVQKNTIVNRNPLGRKV